jgi:hypothetical protein
MNKISLCEFNDLLKLETEEDNNEQCLISHDILIEDNITLECGHKFNYLPLLNEVKYQKLNNNPLEYKKLKINELKCPYCRNIQDKLLPCYSEKIYGVNCPEKYCMKPYKCCYILKSGKRKGETCSKDSFRMFCKQHTKKNDLQMCEEILKTGKNKGEKCSCKVFKNNMCKRHYTIFNK